MTTKFEKQPVLIEAPIRIRPLRQEDWPSMFAVASNPLIWELHPASDRWKEEVFRRYFDEAMACGTGFAICELESDRVIGSSRYGFERAGPDEVEIGWTFLAREYWGGATNRIVKRLMVGHALKFRERAIFLVGEENVRSRRAMEKIGGVLSDRTFSAEMRGTPSVHVIYHIDRHNFENGPLSLG